MPNLRKSIAISFGEKYFCMGLQFAASLIIARLITPEDFGIFGLAYSIVGFAHALRDMGVTNYLIQEPELTPTKVRAALFASITVAWSIAVIIFFLTPVIEDFYNPDVGQATKFLILTVIVVPLGSTIVAVFMREMNFVSIMKINVSGTIANTAVSLLLAYNGHGFMALVWGSVAAQVAIVVVASVLRPGRDHFLPSPRGIKGILRFGTIATSASMLGQFSHNLANLITAKFVPLHELGLFNRGQSVTGLFSKLLMDAVYPVILPQMSEMRRANIDLGHGAVLGISCLAVLAWPFFLFIALFADPLVLLLFGGQWVGTGDLLHIMAIAGLFWIVQPVVNPLLIAAGRVELTLHAQLINQPVAVIGVLIAAMHGIEAVAVAATPISAFHAVVWAWYLCRVVPVDTRFALECALKPLLITAVASTVGVGLMWATVGFEPFWRLSLGATATGAAWLFAVFAVRHPLAEEIRRLMEQGLAAARDRLTATANKV